MPRLPSRASCAPVHADSIEPVPVRVCAHPLCAIALCTLRDRSSSASAFRDALTSLATVLAVEALTDLPLVPVGVATPLASTTGARMAGKLALVPVLRAGLGMVDPILRLVPEASVWHIGLARDEQTLRPTQYYARLPDPGAIARALVLDPMLATGGSAVATLDRLKTVHPGPIALLCAIAAPEGIDRLNGAHPDVRVFCGAIDRGLTDRGFITPGLGDAGDRQFGTAE